MPDNELQTYDTIIREAVRAFWGNPEEQFTETSDESDDSQIRAGKTMNGFCHLIGQVVHRHGLPHAEVLTQGLATTLPGYVRPSKKWDVVIYNGGRLLGAVEFKSMRRSFGKNINNRAEEALGSATDLIQVFERGVLKEQPRPFIGYIMLTAVTPESTRVQRDRGVRLGVDGVFQDVSYAQRYDTLCTRLVASGIYSAAALLRCDRRLGHEGHYESMSQNTSIAAFIDELGAHVAKEAQRSAPA